MSEQDVLQGMNAGASRVGVTGAVRTAALGTPIVPLGTKYNTNVHRNAGYLAPDGLEISFDEDKQEWIPWQEVNPIRVDITKAVKSIKFVLWETSVGNLAKFLGVSETEIKEDKAGNVAFWEGSLPEFIHEWLALDVVDGDKALRLTLPDAQITERGSLVLKRDEMLGLELTYSTFPAGQEYTTSEPDAVGKSAHWQFNKQWKEAGEISTATDGVEALQIATDALPSAEAGTEYAGALAATGGVAPYVWSIQDGVLPDGLTLSSDGVISGTPTVTGEVELTVRVQDSKSLFASKKLESAKPKARAKR